MVFQFHMKSGGFHEIRWFHMKSSRFHEIHPKPYKSKCFNQNYSVWWMQERGYDIGFHEILGHSPLPAPPKLKSFCWNIWFYKVLGGFHMKSTRFQVKSAGFQNMSFCVMTKYRSFFRKTKKQKERRHTHTHTWIQRPRSKTRGVNVLDKWSFVSGSIQCKSQLYTTLHSSLPHVLQWFTVHFTMYLKWGLGLSWGKVCSMGSHTVRITIEPLTQQSFSN